MELSWYFFDSISTNFLYLLNCIRSALAGFPLDLSKRLLKRFISIKIGVKYSYYIINSYYSHNYQYITIINYNLTLIMSISEFYFTLSDSACTTCLVLTRDVSLNFSGIIYSLNDKILNFLNQLANLNIILIVFVLCISSFLEIKKICQILCSLGLGCVMYRGVSQLKMGKLNLIIVVYGSIHLLF